LSPSLDVVHVCGSIAAGQIHRPSEVLRLAGGKSLNVSRALAGLGRPVRAIVPLGGLIGELVAELVDPALVTLARVEASAPTRMCLTAADTTNRTQTEFYERAADLDGPELDAIEPLLEEIAAGDWLVTSGSVPPGVDLDRLGAMITGCADRGVRVAVDVHGDALTRLVETADVIKVNRSEAEALVGAGDLVAVAEAVRQRGTRRPTVVLTDGAAGAVGLDPSGAAWSVRTPSPPHGYPVGSGDCFLAALVSELELDRGLVEALTLANAVGAANAQQPGGAIFDLDLVADLRAVTDVSPIR